MFDSNNLRIGESQEAEIIEKIRISYIKNRGNSLLVTKELDGLPKEYVFKILKKFKHESKIQMPTLVAEKVLEHLMLGYTTRTQYLFETLQEAERGEKSYRSTCCKGLVRPLDRVFDSIGATKGFECLDCHKECDVYVYLNVELLNTKMNAIERLRKEDEQLYKFLVENKYTKTPEKVVNVTQDNSININNPKLSQGEITELTKLGGLEQESLRLKIEKKLMDAEISEDGDGE